MKRLVSRVAREGFAEASAIRWSALLDVMKPLDMTQIRVWLRASRRQRGVRRMPRLHTALLRNQRKVVLMDTAINSTWVLHPRLAAERLHRA
jgi:hypothetical protein